MLKKGENTIEWQAGKLRTHYWLRKAEVELAFEKPVEVRFSVPKVENALFWEGRFDQCSYNALCDRPRPFLRRRGLDKRPGAV